MKQTAKRVAAVTAARTLQIDRPDRLANDDLYARLAAAGLIWYSKRGIWEVGSTSMFTDANGIPSGLIRIRIMGHKSELDLATERIGKVFKILDTSEDYPNRRGQGSRRYLTVINYG